MHLGSVLVLAIVELEMVVLLSIGLHTHGGLFRLLVLVKQAVWLEVLATTSLAKGGSCRGARLSDLERNTVSTCYEL